MKSRMGFVSNSSSSSFIVIVDKKTYDNAISEAHPFTQAVVKGLRSDNIYEGRIIDRDLIILGRYSGRGGEDTWDYLEYDGPEWRSNRKELYSWETDSDLINNPDEAYELFIAGLPKGSYINADIGDGG